MSKNKKQWEGFVVGASSNRLGWTYCPRLPIYADPDYNIRLEWPRHYKHHMANYYILIKLDSMASVLSKLAHDQCEVYITVDGDHADLKIKAILEKTNNPYKFKINKV